MWLSENIHYIYYDANVAVLATIAASSHNSEMNEQQNIQDKAAVCAGKQSRTETLAIFPHVDSEDFAWSEA